MTRYNKNSAHLRKTWENTSEKDKRFGRKFGLAVFAVFVSIALLEGQMGPLF